LQLKSVWETHKQSLPDAYTQIEFNHPKTQNSESLIGKPLTKKERDKELLGMETSLLPLLAREVAGTVKSECHWKGL